jgi:hypothetical protein
VTKELAIEKFSSPESTEFEKEYGHEENYRESVCVVFAGSMRAAVGFEGECPDTVAVHHV